METGTPMARWKELAKALVRVPARFPLPLVAAAIAAVTAILMTHGWLPDESLTLRVLLASIFGFPVLVAAALAGELRPARRWVWALAGLAATFGVWATSDGLRLPGAMAVKLVLLILSATALASSVAGLGRNQSGNWWRMNVGTLNAAILAGIFTGIVLIGLQLALVSVSKLFGIWMDRYYGDVFWVCSMFLGPGVFLGLLPVVRSEIDASGPGFAPWRLLSKYALVPLGLLYTGLLIAYGVKNLAVGSLPDGMVALPVLVLGAFGTAATLLLHPWRETEAWARWFSRIFPVAYLVLSVMLFLSFAARIGDYGVTAQRYLGLAAGIWFALVSLIFLIRPGRLLGAVPLSLCLIALVSAVGPFSAARVSLASQGARLAALLKSGASTDGDAGHDAASIVRYLSNEYGAVAVERFTGPLGLGPEASGWQVQQAALEALDLPDESSRSSDAEAVRFHDESGFDVAGFRKVFLQPPRRPWPIALGTDGEGMPLLVKLENGDLIAVAGNKTLGMFSVNELSATVPGAGKPAPSFEWSHEGRHWKLIVLEVEWWTDADGGRRVRQVSAVVFEK